MTEFRPFLHAWQVGAVLRSVQPLAGGTSARVTALEVVVDGQERRVVLRRHGARDLAANPRVAEKELKILRALHAAGLPVPEPLAGGPDWVLTSFLEGESGLEAPPPALAEGLAAFLARLHALPSGELVWPASRVLPPVPPPARVGETPLEGRIRALLAASPVQPGRTALLHGDLWPGNTLWRGPALAGVIDWEDAALGDPLDDVANTRLELWLLHGPQAAEAFTDAYAGRMGAALGALPPWSLRCALRAAGSVANWGLDAAREREVRARLAAFAAQAEQAISR